MGHICLLELLQRLGLGLVSYVPRAHVTQQFMSSADVRAHGQDLAYRHTSFES